MLDGWLFEIVEYQQNLVTICYYQERDEFALMVRLLHIISDLYDIIGCLVPEGS